MIDEKNYLKNFTPKFNKTRFKELMEETPSVFNTPFGKVSTEKRFVKSILLSCKLLNDELDRNNIYYGGEGAGKSHTVFQHTYLWWWCLNELEMINYEFGLHLVYGRLKDLIGAMDKYAHIPYMIYTLDESDEINRKNWNKAEVKEFMSKLRRERKNLRIVNFLLPALEEMLPSIALSRINWVFELDCEMDEEFNLIRGKWKMLNIPVGKVYYSLYNKKYLSRKQIKRYLNNRFYNKDLLFENLPNSLIAYTGVTNKTFMFDKQEYKKWAREINKKLNEDDTTDSTELQKVREQRDILITRENKIHKLSHRNIGNLINLEPSGIGKITLKTPKEKYLLPTEQ